MVHVGPGSLKALKRLKLCIALHGNPSQSYRASVAIWNHTVLPATRHKWTFPAITPANQAGTRFTYPGGMEGWVDLGSLIVARPGIEPTTTWSQVWRPNRYTTKRPFYTFYCDVAVVFDVFVQQVNTKVAKEGHTTRYLQRYLKAWESNPEFRSNTRFSIASCVGVLLCEILRTCTYLFKDLVRWKECHLICEEFWLVRARLEKFWTYCLVNNKNPSCC